MARLFRLLKALAGAAVLLLLFTPWFRLSLGLLSTGAIVFVLYKFVSRF